MELSDYNKKKDYLKSLMNQLFVIAQELHMYKHSSQIEENIARLENEKFELVVVGEFSRGKSTFVNAMLGKRILPSSKRPTTTIISKITYGRNPNYIIHFKDGQSPLQVAGDEFFEIKAKTGGKRERMAGLHQAMVDNLLSKIKKAPEKEKTEFDNIDFAEVKYPLEFCRNNVEIVDTPGTNDLNVGRMEITYNYLNNADAVILVLSATQPMSASEMDFLKQKILTTHIRDIFFVVNFKDQLDNDNDEKRVFQYVKEMLTTQLQNISKESLHVYLVSSKQALIYRRSQNGETLSAKKMLDMPKTLNQTGFPDFERDLSYYLDHEKGKAKIQKYVGFSKTQIEEMSKLLSVRRQMISHSSDEICGKAEAMEPEFYQARYNATQAINRMKTNLQRSIGDVDNQCTIYADQILKAGLSAINNLPGKATASNLETAINRAITAAQHNFIEQMAQYENKLVSDEMSKTQVEIQRVWDNIEARYFSNFNVGNNINSKSLSMTNRVSMRNVQHMMVKDDVKGVGGFLTGSFGVGMGIGALIAGTSLLPAVGVFAFAAFISGIFEDKDAKRRAQARTDLTRSYNENIGAMRKKLISIYKNEIDNICGNVQKKVSDKIDEMELELKNIISEKENSLENAEQQDKRIVARQNALRSIYTEINALDFK